MVDPKAYRLEAYFFLRVARFLVARFLVARFLVARFLVARFLVARFFVARFLVARFLVARFLVARFFVARFFVARFFVARFLVARFFVVRFLAGFLFAVRFFAGFLFFVDRFFAVAISTSSKVGQDCRCTYRIVTSLHVSSGTAHELYITLPYLSEMFCNLDVQHCVIVDKRMLIRSRWKAEESSYERTHMRDRSWKRGIA
ncbi:MAG: hypothetical protein JSV06_08600 [Myxococcales bacterium]|nr:MAG: hypothetical protein JSV06_08600 [Myxococcales bacterium]